MRTRMIIVHPVEATAREWREAVASRCPGAEISVWPRRLDRPAEYAIGWDPPPDFFEHERGLKALFVAGAGVDGILERQHVPRSLPIVRLEDAGMARQMAEYCRHEVARWCAGRLLPVGVFGIGVLGLEVAKTLASLGHPVRAYARAARSIDGISCYADTEGIGELRAFLRETRVLILLAPLTPRTRDRFDEPTLALLPRGSYVINVARGALLVDRALLAGLDSGHLAGATLDVCRQEPLPPAHPFRHHPRIRVTPHIAARTLVAEAANQIVRKIADFEAGRVVTGVVDRSRGY